MKLLNSIFCDWFIVHELELLKTEIEIRNIYKRNTSPKNVIILCEGYFISLFNVSHY